MENFYNMTWGVYFHATWDKIYRIKSIKKMWRSKQKQQKTIELVNKSLIFIMIKLKMEKNFSIKNRAC